MQPERNFRYWSKWLLVFVAAWSAAFFTLAPEPVELLRKNWLFIPVGFFGALLGNISAVGGGIVFIPVMIFAFHLAPVTSLKVALASQSFGMTSGGIGWMQKRVVPFEALKLTVPGLLIGSTISSLIIHPNALLIKLLFGPVSIGLGVLMLVMVKRADGAAKGAGIPRQAAVPLVVASMLGGLITGWIAIGEGELVAALLMLVYGVNATTAIGLGVVLLSINSIYLTLLHSVFLGGIPWEIAAFTGLGCVFGARLAPWVAHRARPALLKVVFATIAIADGILFIVQYWILRRG